ncbi:MAG: hypothetical protein H7Y07_03920 [Pyrinomonadaceae bacterium]|nr:hypothetical protein [Sphingobacteriaceae bacterium]
MNKAVLFVASLLWILTSNTASFAQNKKIDVYLIGGQSNATGQGYLKNLPKNFKIDTRVIIFHSGKPHLNSGVKPLTWHPLRQASESPDRFGPELGFGNRIKELEPGKNIAIIKHAHSGTNLYAQWKPGNTTTDSTNWGPQYKDFVQTVDAALQALRKQGYKITIEGMLWQQGESDADKLEQNTNYGKNLAHFIQRVRQQFDAPKMKFVYGYVYPPPTTGIGPETIRKAQHDVAQKSKTSLSVKRAILVETDDLNHRADDPNSPYPKDHIHFGTLGTLELGIRMANAMVNK